MARRIILEMSIIGDAPQSAGANTNSKIGATVGPDGDKPAGIDKSALAVAAPRRYRDKDHLRHVAKQPCLICGRKPSDPHHLRHLQPRALGRKASDEFAVPLCRIHHRLVHRVGNEAAWWQDAGIDPIKAASQAVEGDPHRCRADCARAVEDARHGARSNRKGRRPCC